MLAALLLSFIRCLPSFGGNDIESPDWSTYFVPSLSVTVISPSTQATINQADLKFGDEFLWNGNTTAGEIKLAWAEVSETGVITYAV